MKPVDLRANAPQLRLTLASAIAASLATLTLTPLFTGTDWLWESLLAITVVALVGAGGRLLHVARVPVALLQLFGLLTLVTARFAPDNATFGLLPSATSLRDLLDLANEGAASINEQTVPVLDVPGIALIVSVGIGLAALEIDLSSVACRSPAIAGIVILAVYGVTIAVLPFGASWWWFAVGTAAWLLLLYVGRREAVAEWGDTRLGGDSPWLGAGDPRAALAWQIGVGAVLAGVLVAGLVPGVGDGVVGRVTAWGDGGGGGDASTGSVRLDISATIKRNLQSDKDTPLLRYEAQDESPQYLRLAVLDRFDGVAWQPAGLPIDAPSTADGMQETPLTTAEPDDAKSLTTSVTSFGAARDLAYLPAPYTPVQYDGLTSDWLWDVDTSTAFSRSTRLGAGTYNVLSHYLPPNARDLATQTNGGSLVDPVDKVLPDGLPETLGAVAQTAVDGAESDYAKAVRLQGYFRSSYRYSLDAPPTDTATAIIEFLNSRVGYCQQFAATYALMARSVGLASRVVVGFTPGTPAEGGAYTVSTKDYHAWPEVWFDKFGWVRFEPTPRADSGSRIDVPAWSLPNAFAPPNAPRAEASEAPSSTPTASSAPDRQPVDEGEVAAAPDPSWGDRLAPVGALGLVLLLAAAALAPGLARAARRRRRLAPTTEPITAEHIEDAWDELADTARDLGVPWADDDTPRRSADALVHSAGLDGRAASSVQNLRRGVELSRYAGRPGEAGAAESPADSVRRVRRSLLAGSSRADRLRAAITPRTAFRRSGRKPDQ